MQPREHIPGMIKDKARTMASMGAETARSVADLGAETARTMADVSAWQRLLRFVRHVLVRARRDRISLIAASLTFTTLLSLVPMLTIALSVIAAFPLFAGVMKSFQGFLIHNLMPGDASKVVFGYLEQFSGNAARMTAIGVVFLAITAFTLMQTIEGAFNVIWRVQQARPLKTRLFIFWSTLTLGPVLLGGSVSLTAWLIHNAHGVSTHALWTLASVLLNATAFALLYATVANRYVPPRHAVLGGFIAGLAFDMMKRGFSLYLAFFPSYTVVYGAFAAIPIFLLWVYVSWMIVLYGAVLTAALSQWRGEVWRKTHPAGWQFYQSLAMLRLFREAGRAGAGLTPETLHQRMRLGFEDIDEVLDGLAASRLVARAAHGWVLCRDLREVTLGDLHRRLVVHHEGFMAPEDTWLGAVAARLRREQPAALALSLDALMDAPGGEADSGAP